MVTSARVSVRMVVRVLPTGARMEPLAAMGNVARAAATIWDAPTVPCAWRHVACRLALMTPNVWHPKRARMRANARKKGPVKAVSIALSQRPIVTRAWAAAFRVV